MSEQEQQAASEGGIGQSASTGGLGGIDDLYVRLECLSKLLEGSGRIDERDDPYAYATILGAMNFWKDAARYRFLREAGSDAAKMDALNRANKDPQTPEEFDAAVDMAMSEFPNAEVTGWPLAARPVDWRVMHKSRR